MSDTPNIGARIELQGEKEYRDALREINNSHRVLNSELKASAAEFIGNANSMDALAAKNDILIKKQNEQKKAVELLRGALQNAGKEFGENSKQAQEYEIKLNNAYAELKKLDKELDTNQKYLKEAEDSTDKTAKSIDEFGKKVKEAEKSTSVFGDVLKANLTGEAIIGGVKAIVNGLQGIITETEEYRQDFAMLETNASTAGAAITDVGKELKNLDAITKETDSNVEALSNLLQAGFKGESLSDAVEALTGAVIKFPDTLKIEGLADGLQETLATGKAIGPFAEMLERLGYNLEDFNYGLSRTTTEAEKQQYALKILASTGLAEVNQQYRENNKDMIAYAEAQYEMREIMSEVATAAIPLLSKSMSVLSENMDEIADDVLPVFLNGFNWMVENSDFIISGLKGIGAALITRKAAEGIEYAVTAYKTLTTATQTATAAQVAFNTASKASIIGAVASVIVGLGTALYSYAKANSDAVDTASRLNEELDKQIEKSDKLRDTIISEVEARKTNTKEMESENHAAKTLIDSLYDLAETESKTNETKQQMAALIDEINEQIPELSLEMDAYTGVLNKQRNEVEKLVDANLRLQMVEAAKDDLSTIATNKYEAEKNLNTYLEARLEYEHQIEEARERYNKALDGAKYSELGWNFDTLKYGNELTKLTEKWQENEDKINDTTRAITDLGKEYQTALGYIGNNSQLDQATSSLDSFSTKLRKALQDQDTSHIKSVSERNKAINKEYETLSKAQEKILKEEAKAFDKAQTEKVDLVKKASEKEIKTLELAHKEKLKLIDAEYLEKLKNTDEDKYKELKAVQDKIDDLDNLSEAEDRALKNKEDAEKKAELQARVDNAKTVEERLEAQKELKDFEDTLARERLRTERDLQKDILEEQKTAIEEAYDAKIATLEEEKAKEEEKANESFEKNKEIAQNKLSTELEVLEEIQEKEKESFTERQTELKDHLKEQKDLAIENAKTIYEEELKEYKINLASKYDAAVENEKMIYDVAMQYNQDKAKINHPAVTDTLKNTPVWSSDRVFGNQSAGHILNKALANAPAQYSFSEIEDALIASIKQLNLKVVLNEKELGRVLDNHLKNTLR